MNDSGALIRGLAIWLVPFAILAGVLGYETDWGNAINHAAVAPPAPPPQPVAVALLPEYRIDGGLDARKETIDRVLFNPTRRPAPPASQSTANASTMKRGLYTLTGTTVVDNIATAFVREVNGGKSRSVRKGDTLSGMLVADVGADSIRLKQGDEVEELSLKVAAGPKTTVQPAPVVAAGQAAAGGTQPAAAAAAAAQPAGGTAGGRPQAVAGVPQQPVAPAAAPRPANSVSVSELLAERRRAARAAAESAAAGRAPRGTPQ
jgi:hypothetical protein